MRADVQEAMTRSAAVMQYVVWPLVGPMIGGGRLIPVEAVTSAGFAKELDTLAGIDAWQIIDQLAAVRGIASRVQGPRDGKQVDYRTFTVRCRLRSGLPTEYHKRLAELDAHDGRLKPHLFCQAYITDWRHPVVLSAAVARVSDVINAVRMGYATDEIPVPGGNFLRAVSWETLQKLDSPIRIYPPPNGPETQLVLPIEDL